MASNSSWVRAKCSLSEVGQPTLAFHCLYSFVHAEVQGHASKRKYLCVYWHFWFWLMLRGHFGINTASIHTLRIDFDVEVVNRHTTWCPGVNATTQAYFFSSIPRSVHISYATVTCKSARV